MSKVIDAYKPTKLLLGHGSPILVRSIEEIQKFALTRQNYEEFEFPADSIIDCWKCLSDVVHPYLKTHNITIAPMSTKLSTIATLLTAEQFHEIQIAYSVPGEYNIDNYSEGMKTLYIDEIPRTKHRP